MSLPAEDRAAIHDAFIVDALPPRAAALAREHLLRCAPQHGVSPHESRADRSIVDHLNAADRHMFAVAKMGAPGWDPGAVDADTGRYHLVAVACRALLALELVLIEDERKAGGGC